MRIVIAASLATAAALAAVSALGVASAEAPTTTPPQRTMSVQGVATASIDPHASAAAASAAYHQAMADAVADGLGKAQLLAGKAGASLGAIQSVVEGGGYIQCAGAGESGNAEYEGAQPDFGSPGVSVAATPSVGAVRQLGGVRKPTARRHRARRKSTAKTANATSCTLFAQVSLVYPLS